MFFSCRQLHSNISYNAGFGKNKPTKQKIIWSDVTGGSQRYCIEAQSGRHTWSFLFSFLLLFFFFFFFLPVLLQPSRHIFIDQQHHRSTCQRTEERATMNQSTVSCSWRSSVSYTTNTNWCLRTMRPTMLIPRLFWETRRNILCILDGYYMFGQIRKNYCGGKWLQLKIFPLKHYIDFRKTQCKHRFDICVIEHTLQNSMN